MVYAGLLYFSEWSFTSQWFKGCMYDNSLSLHSTDLETEPQGMSVAWLTEMVRWEDRIWTQCPGSGFVLLAHSAGAAPEECLCHQQWPRGQAVAGRPDTSPLPNLPGLFMKCHNCHINTGAMPSILVAFRSQEPVWSCTPRFMLPTSIRANGRCLHKSWAATGVTTLVLPSMQLNCWLWIGVLTLFSYHISPCISVAAFLGEDLVWGEMSKGLGWLFL